MQTAPGGQEKEKSQPTPTDEMNNYPSCLLRHGIPNRGEALGRTGRDVLRSWANSDTRSSSIIHLNSSRFGSSMPALPVPLPPAKVLLPQRFDLRHRLPVPHRAGIGQLIQPNLDPFEESRDLSQPRVRDGCDEPSREKVGQLLPHVSNRRSQHRRKRSGQSLR